jgi:hypothetical protein
MTHPGLVSIHSVTSDTSFMTTKPDVSHLWGCVLGAPSRSSSCQAVLTPLSSALCTLLLFLAL